jgi:hypothetical protein
LVAIFGILIPYWKGIDFFDPVIIAAYACMGALFSAPASAQAFAVNRPQSMREAFARIGKAVLYGEGLAMAFLVVGTATVDLMHGGRLLLPEIDTLAEAGLLGLAGTIAVAGLAGWATLRFSPAVARLLMRVLFLSLLIAFFYNARRLTDVALMGTGLCVAAAAIAVLLLRKEVSPR